MLKLSVISGMCSPLSDISIEYFALKRIKWNAEVVRLRVTKGRREMKEDMKREKRERER